MPVTPFHLGPGLLLKAVLRGAFSLMIFGWANLLIDIQPIVRGLTGRGEWHGWTHTLGGALVIGAVAAASGKYLAEAVLRLAARNATARRPGTRVPTTVRWWVAVSSALLGTLSHIWLDGYMHSDVRPLAPFTDATPWLGDVSVGGVYLACVIAGALGFVGYLGVLWWTARPTRADAGVRP